MGLEGVISKRAESRYRSGRNRDWLKIKCSRRQEVIVGGFTEPSGTRSDLGALLLGVMENGKLRYAGKVGTGFDASTLRELRGSSGAGSAEVAARVAAARALQGQLDLSAVPLPLAVLVLGFGLYVFFHPGTRKANGDGPEVVPSATGDDLP